jgi:hypothetical protein
VSVSSTTKVRNEDVGRIMAKASLSPTIVRS